MSFHIAFVWSIDLGSAAKHRTSAPVARFDILEEDRLTERPVLVKMATEKNNTRSEVSQAQQNGSASDDMASQPKPGFAATLREVTTANRSNQHLYITGLRGILVIQSFLWTYFHTFIPTLTSSSTPGPVYQDILRDIFSVPLWNDSLIYNFFIILSMRTIAVSFLQNPTGQTYAATVIRRIVRMTLILCIGSGLATAIFSQIGVDFINDFKTKLPNQTIQTPVKTYDAISAWNSLFDLFWITTEFFSQAANTFWPTRTLWVPSIIYFQVFQSRCLARLKTDFCSHSPSTSSWSSCHSPGRIGTSRGCSCSVSDPSGWVTGDGIR